MIFQSQESTRVEQGGPIHSAGDRFAWWCMAVAVADTAAAAAGGG